MKKHIITILFVAGLFAGIPQVKAETTSQDRVYILSTVWRNVRDNFAFPQHFQQADPDSLFRAFLPRVMKAESENEFSLLMTEFLAKFGDAHTRFFAESQNATVPVQFIGIDNKVYVRNIGKSLVKKIPIGSQLLKVDGVSVSDYLESKIYPYVSAANDDWKFRKSLDSFLNGEVGSEVTLEFLTPKHKTETPSFNRMEPRQLEANEWSKVLDQKRLM